jgi:hypothetical protein
VITGNSFEKWGTNAGIQGIRTVARGGAVRGRLPVANVHAIIRRRFPDEPSGSPHVASMNPAPSPPPETPPLPPDPGAAARPSFLRVVAMVLSAFVGIRKRSSAEAAHQEIKPAHVVVAGIIGAVLFIAILVTLIRFIIVK